MNPLEAHKYVIAVAPAAIKDNAAFTATEIDTLGHRFVAIVIQVGATDIAMAALKVQQSDTSGSGFGDVTGLIFGTSTNLAGDTSSLPAATDDNKIFLFFVDMRGKKRYLKVSATAGDGTSGTYLSGIAVLGAPELGPDAAADWGASQVLRA